MRQDDIMLYIEALIAAGYLALTARDYPTIYITKAGEQVMRDHERAQLALPETDGERYVLAPSFGDERVTPSTGARQAYALYRKGLSVEQIAQRRNCQEETIHEYLSKCVRAGFPLDVTHFVSPADRALIETAIATHGTNRLRPIYESLPDGITYGMIRLVVADLIFKRE
jgi:uncharacterized protein YpbB